MNMRTTIGTKERPLGSVEPMKVARRVIEGLWPAEQEVPGILEFRGEVWVWEEGRWRKKGDVAVEDAVRLSLEDSMCLGPEESLVRYKVTGQKVREVTDGVRALARQVTNGSETVPMWLGKGECPVDPERTIAFEDVLVDVTGGGEKEVKRGREWFDPAVMPVKRAKGSRGAAWEKAVKGWSRGDEKWEKLAQRMSGAVVMAGRHHQRWGLVFGEAGTGKSVYMGVLERLLGRDAYMSTDAVDLASGFGLDGVQCVRLVAVKEMTQLAGADGEAVGGTMKRLMGGDEVTVNVKHQRQEKNVRAKAWVMVTSNPIPKLPNSASGLSQKMLVLPFTEVFRGEEKEDLGLRERLEKELPAIAEWVLEGAKAVEGSGARERWPVPHEAEEVVRGFHLQNNAADAFLEARFQRSEEGFVPLELIWKEWEDWKRANRVKTDVARNRLTMYLVGEGTWRLRRWRSAGGGARGLRGLSLKQGAEE
jgi:P4 family phage/plasmid primase-like protien